VQPEAAVRVFRIRPTFNVFQSEHSVLYDLSYNCLRRCGAEKPVISSIGPFGSKGAAGVGLQRQSVRHQEMRRRRSFMVPDSFEVLCR